MNARLAGLVLVVCSLALNLPGTWSLPLLDRDEALYAEAAREMRERGDYIVPYNNNAFFLHKPPLLYWCQVACFEWLGETEFAARLPSVLATTLTALVVFGFGRRLYGTPAGFWAGVIFNTSLHTLVLARGAVADMPMILFSTLAVWAGWELVNPRDPAAARVKFPGWWWCFWTAMALAFLAKGPVGWLPLGALLLAVGWTRHRGAVRALRWPVGVVWMLALVAIWGVPALMRTNGQYLTVGLGRHVLGRGFQAMDSHGGKGLFTYLASLPVYLITVWISFFPWSIWLPWLVRTARCIERRFSAEVYLAAGVVLTFTIFSLYRTKLPHYILPAFPLLSLLLAGLWFRAGRTVQVWRGWAIAITVFALGLSLIRYRWLAQYFPARQLASQSAAWLTPEMEFASVDFNEPSLVWCFRAYVHGWHRSLRLNEIPKYMAQSGPRFCIVPTSQAASLLAAAPTGWKTFSVKGVNPVNFRAVDLTLLLKPSSP